MRFALVLSLLALLVSFVSAQSLCFQRPSFLGSTCSPECNLRGHPGGNFNDGQCCCNDVSKRSLEDNRRSAEEFFGGSLRVAEDKTLEVQKPGGVSRISCSLCNIGPLDGGDACCEASCKSISLQNSGHCDNNVCVCA
ncbi:hypothetical protein MNAN1_003666 [Malassezia nana]|uniref:Defensin-like protein n=1 Tax=Malassezia nana TaxID=180528 RepID=A0AAF0EQ83_9BASI|nr:hypothetical protein MNAN1_003666 [Malassezia nana]